MTGFLENNALKFFGHLNDDQIATLNKRLPDLMNLVHTAETHIDQLQRVVKDLAPIFQQILATQQELGQ